MNSTTLKHQIFRILLISLVLFLFALMFWPFFTPILFASLFAFALEKMTSRLTSRFKRRSWAALLALLALFLFVTIPVGIIILKLFTTIKDYINIGFQNTQLYQMTEKFLSEITLRLTTLTEKFDIDLAKLPQLNDILSQASTAVASTLTGLVSKLPQITLGFFVFMAALYYFLIESKKIKALVIKLDLLSLDELDQLIDIIQKGSYLTLVASLIIGSSQALIVALVGFFCGFNEFLLLFITTFVFSLIPVVGAAPVAVFLSILAFVQGHTGAGIGMLVAAALVGSLDNLIKPLIVNSNNEDLHPLVSLLALVGAIFIYGPPGILLGPIITQLAFKIGVIFFPKVTEKE